MFILLGSSQQILFFLLGIQTYLEAVFTVNQHSFSLATACPLHLVLVKTSIPSRYLIFKWCLERAILSHSQNSQRPFHQKIYKMMIWVYEKWALGDTMIIWCINISLKTSAEEQCKSDSVGSSAKNLSAETTRRRQIGCRRGQWQLEKSVSLRATCYGRRAQITLVNNCLKKNS